MRSLKQMKFAEDVKLITEFLNFVLISCKCNSWYNEQSRHSFRCKLYTHGQEQLSSLVFLLSSDRLLHKPLKQK